MNVKVPLCCKIVVVAGVAALKTIAFKINNFVFLFCNYCEVAAVVVAVVPKENCTLLLGVVAAEEKPNVGAAADVAESIVVCNFEFFCFKIKLNLMMALLLLLLMQY